MPIAAARLEADDLTTFPLERDEGIIVSELDIGFPAIRGVVEERPEADGEVDETAYIGARAVVLSGTIAGVPAISTRTYRQLSYFGIYVAPVPEEIVTTPAISRQTVMDRLRAFLRPDVRPYLIYRLEADGSERRIRLRADQHSTPIVRPGSAEFSVAFRGPDGIQEAVAASSSTADATADEGGRQYPLVFNRSYPASPTLGVVTVTNAGNAFAYPVLKLYGPATGPAIENQTLGKALEFPGLVLAAGEHLEIDTRAKTIRLDGSASQSRYEELDFETSTWWALAPGANAVRYYPSGFAAGAEAVIEFRSTWL